MTALLARLLGRMPLGWLQLTHNKARMATAVAGVAFANVLVFVQLGILGALLGTVALSWSVLRADVVVSATDASTLSDGSSVARRHLFRALAVPGVADAAPLYVGTLDFTRPDGTVATMTLYGVRPEDGAFVSPDVAAQLAALAVPDTVLFDVATRDVPADAVPALFEANGLALAVVGTYAVGGGFIGDGSMIVSDQTFLRLFDARLSGTPTHILLAAEPGVDGEALAARIADALGPAAGKVRTLERALSDDLAYQATQRPVGIIFGLGVVIGVLVGIVIVYQVLSTDVADHLKEYATFKAMGYRQAFFLGVVFEEAMVLALIGFVPGVATAWAIYEMMAVQTGLPVEMGLARAAAVFFGTLAACTLSGAIATRRLAAADPAELF